MTYSPKSLPTVTTLEELRSWVEDELQMIAQEVNGGDARLVVLQPANVAPVKPRDGMIVYADGVNFNPGSGRGTYERKSGAWVKL